MTGQTAGAAGPDRRTRVRLDVAYDGGGFAGWARQPDQRSVQQTLEGAVATVLRIPAVTLTCAGRTDAGVHARGQVAHLDVPADALDRVRAGSSRPWPEVLRRRVDDVLDHDVRVRRCAAAPDGFDARFAARWRRYAYRVCDDPATSDPVSRASVLWWRRPLDLEAMNAAAAMLLGVHDFAAFCRPRPGATTVRELLQLQWARDGSGVAVLDVRADAFCHRMVRALTGALLAVGDGRRPAAWPAEVLHTATRDSAVQVVAAHGLTLEEVGYPPDHELSARVAQTRQPRQMHP